jgi:hypothetical protein
MSGHGSGAIADSSCPHKKSCPAMRQLFYYAEVLAYKLRCHKIIVAKLTVRNRPEI